jgi:hypothetical protein
MNGLPALAQSVQSQGRGNDSMLVHMTPREVGGLQALAMANGGSLTINPQTGLPEAGFLDNILPMIAGAALTIGTSGAIDPFTASMIVGGGTAAVTGDVEKGFQAGFSAYGGAGLGGSLAATGSQTAMQAEAARQAAAMQPATTAAMQPATTAATAATTATSTNPATQALLKTGMSPEQAIAHTKGSTLAATPPVVNVAPPVTPPVATPPSFDMTAIEQAGQQGGLTNLKGGFQALGEEPGRELFMQNVGGYGGLAKYGGAAALPMLMDSGSQGAPAGAPQNIRPYEYDPGRQDATYRTGAPTESTAEQRYFDPRFKPMPIYRAKDGGSVPMLEDGGFVMTKKAVDGLGGGSNKKGQEELKKGLGAIALKGPGARKGPKAGKDDKIKTSIEGKIPARVSHGEAYVTKKGVRKAGGTTNMYELMRRAARKA